MAKRTPDENVTLETVLKLVDQLSLEEQAELRRTFFEDQEDIRIALERLARPGKIWSHEEIKRELGLGD